MDHQPVVVVLGHSLLIDGVATSLADKSTNNIIQADPDIADTKPCIQSLNPDLIILEMNDPRIDTMFSLLKANPAISLLGLNEGHSRALIIKPQECTLYTMQDFHAALQKALH